MAIKRSSRSETSETETTVISRRELARELRRKAYRDAKARRATDPRFLAMKEAAKQRRRELYQVAKQKKKAAVGSSRAGGSASKPGAEDEKGKRKADARAALAQALGALREAKAAGVRRQHLQDLIESVKLAGDRAGAANDRT